MTYAPANRPGAQTFGVNGLTGGYAGLESCVRQGCGGCKVYRPGHWALAGTQLGATSRIFGYEADGVGYRMEDSLPFANGADGADPTLDFVAMALATNIEPARGVWGETADVADVDATLKARALFGEIIPVTLDRSSRGNGAIVHWHR